MAESFNAAPVAPPTQPREAIGAAIRTATVQETQDMNRTKTLESRNIILKGLPPKERQKMKQRFQTLDTSQQNIEGMFGGDLEGAISHQKALLESSRLDAADREHVSATLAYLAGIRERVKAEVYDFFDLAKKSHIDLARQLTESKIDRYTGLFLRGTLLDEFHRTVFSEWLKNPNSIKLQNHVVYAIDMNNFKAGNNVLGHEGFDEFIADMCQSFVTTSRYLGKDSAKEYAYGRHDPDDPKAEQTLEKMFPEGEKREMLEQARSEGVVVEFFRDKAGADEALFFIHYEQGKTPEREELAENLINTVFRHHALPKTGEKVTKADLAKMVQTAQNFSNRLKIEGNDVAEICRGFGINPEAILYLNKVADEARSRIMTSKAAEAISADPDCRLRMGASLARADMNEAFNRFIYGIPLPGDNVRDTAFQENRLINPVTGQMNEQAMVRYVNHITSNTGLYLSAIGIKQPEILAEVMEESIGYEASNPIIGETMGSLMKHVDNRQKHLDKLQLIADAVGGDPESLYQLAALVHDGRIMDTINSPHTRLLVLMTVEQDMQRRYDGTQQPKTEDRQDPHLQIVKQAYDRFLKERGVSRDDFYDFESLEAAFNTEFDPDEFNRQRKTRTQPPPGSVSSLPA